MSAPKYMEILAVLRSRCSSAPLGTRLTPERKLAQEFGVSTMTIRHSLGQLAEEGWIERKPGSGTYVGRPMVVMGPTLTSFTEDMRRLGLTPSARVLRIERMTPDWETMARLELRAGEDVIRLERLRLADGEPLCHEVSAFPGHLAAAFTKNELTSSVHQMLIGEGVVPHSTSRLVRAVVLPPHACELLNLSEGSPGLEIVDVFVDIQNLPIQFARSRYRFDRYEVLSRIERISHPATGLSR